MSDRRHLNEAEIQVLASVHAAEGDGLPSDRAALEKGGERFWIYLEDWSEAYGSLIAKGLITGDDRGYRLTDAGQPLGLAYHEERPDRYWYYYQRFWQAAHGSAAHSRLCERAFGKDLCQEGMVDMTELGDLLGQLAAKPSDHLLDLGCGAGGITEYISDQSGARITGLDNAAEAIAVATARTAAKRDRLSFQTGDMNALELPARAFDAMLSLDTLYWAADLADTLAQVARVLRPGGRMLIFMMQGPWDERPPGVLPPEDTRLGQALAKLNLHYEAVDYTEQLCAFWQRNWQAAVDLRDEFEAEGNGFIAANLIKEAEEEFLPAIEAGKITRYLYHVRL